MASEAPTPQQPDGPSSSGQSTVLLAPAADRLALLIGGPVTALVIMLALPPFSRWLFSLHIGLPVRPVFRFLSAIDQPWEIAVSVLVAMLIGLSVALVKLTSPARIGIRPDEVRVATADWNRTVPRADVAAVFADGEQLVILDSESRHLVAETTRVRAETLAKAFSEHGYPWQADDPYRDLYRRWIAGTPELPPAVNAVLEARQDALKRKSAGDVRDLREAVERLGFTVREERKTQFWRPLVRA